MQINIHLDLNAKGQTHSIHWMAIGLNFMLSASQADMPSAWLGRDKLKLITGYYVHLNIWFMLGYKFSLECKHFIGTSAQSRRMNQFQRIFMVCWWVFVSYPGCEFLRESTNILHKSCKQPYKSVVLKIFRYLKDETFLRCHYTNCRQMACESPSKSIRAECCLHVWLAYKSLSGNFEYFYDGKISAACAVFYNI